MKRFGFAGYSGSGKTTLIEQLILRLSSFGWTVSLIKHTHHAFDLDQPGKDSWRHRQAGAREVLLAGAQRWALLHENNDQPEPDLDTLCKRLSPCDLVLVEGYKHEPIPKLEIHRPSLGRPLLATQDPHIIAIASDGPVCSALPVLDLNNTDAVYDFILHHLNP